MCAHWHNHHSKQLTIALTRFPATNLTNRPHSVRVCANVIYIWKRSACCRQRSYQRDHARSRPI
eukprot:gene3742-6272_t